MGGPQKKDAGPLSKLDGRDYLMGVGLAMLGIGLSLYSVPLGIAAPGAVLVAVSIFGTR